MKISRCKEVMRSQMAFYGLKSVRRGIWRWYRPVAGPHSPLPVLVGLR